MRVVTDKDEAAEFLATAEALLTPPAHDQRRTRLAAVLRDAPPGLSPRRTDAALEAVAAARRVLLEDAEDAT